MKIKESFFDRFDQTFKLLKGNFFVLIVPIFLYNMISIIIFDIILSTYFTSKIDAINNMENFNIGMFLSDPTVVLLLNIGILIFIIYLLLYVVVFLGILKTIKDITEGNNVSILENLKYGVTRFLPSMKTYWYMFAYVYLTPSLIFISGGILFGLSTYISNEFIGNFGIGLMIVSFFILLYYVIYRGNKSSFALYSAVNSDSFTEKNFDISVSISDNKFWRLFGNLLLVGFIVGAGISMINGLISMILFGVGGGGDLVMNGIEKISNGGSVEDLKTLISSYIENTSLFSDIIGNTLSALIKNIGAVFILIFIYLFYLRLFREYEYTNGDIDDSSDVNNIKL